MRRVLIGALVAATMCVVLTQPAAAATKPKIGLVSLYGGEFSSAQATVWGAVGVVICVSHTCAMAERLASGRWLMGGDRAPLMLRGRHRRVIVFAVSATGGLA
jgi:hypothetical protein